MSANGFLTAAELVTVEDNDQLAPRTAAAFLAFKKYAASQGRSLVIVEPAGAYRSYAVQADMRVHPERYNLNPNSKAGLAAAGKSTHGWGDRVDLGGTALAWIVAHAGLFGFYREFGADDPNHFRHNGTTTAGMPVPVPITIPEEGTTMWPIIVDNYAVFTTGQQFIHHVVAGEVVVKNITTAEDAYYSLSAADFAVWCDNLGIPRSAVRIDKKTVGVLNPVSGVYESGGTWSAELAYRGTGQAGGISDADVLKIAEAVIVEQKKPGN